MLGGRDLNFSGEEITEGSASPSITSQTRVCRRSSKAPTQEIQIEFTVWQCNPYEAHSGDPRHSCSGAVSMSIGIQGGH